jgi:D-aminopeptidase
MSFGQCGGGGKSSQSDSEMSSVFEDVDEASVAVSVQQTKQSQFPRPSQPKLQTQEQIQAQMQPQVSEAETREVVVAQSQYIEKEKVLNLLCQNAKHINLQYRLVIRRRRIIRSRHRHNATSI